MIAAGALAYIPSPPANGISVGSLRLHVYGLMIALGIAAAVWLSQRRWQQIGGRPGTMSALAVWGVPGGLIGARLYSLATSWQVDTGGQWIRGLEIWRGGLGIWGGVVGGVLTGAIGARRAGLRLAPLLDCVAPAFALAQAIGRWGNYFNQELYGRPSGLPWAVRIDHPDGPGSAARTFQPTFLYECIWDLLVCVLVIRIERRYRIRRGYLITAYAALYTVGRFFTEYLRVDDAKHFLGLRLNDWTSIIVFVGAVTVLFLKGRAGPEDERAGDPLPAGSAKGMPGSDLGEESTPDDGPVRRDREGEPLGRSVGAGREPAPVDSYGAEPASGGTATATGSPATTAASPATTAASPATTTRSPRTAAGSPATGEPSAGVPRMESPADGAPAPGAPGRGPT